MSRSGGRIPGGPSGGRELLSLSISRLKGIELFCLTGDTEGTNSSMFVYVLFYVNLCQD